MNAYNGDEDFSGNLIIYFIEKSIFKFFNWSFKIKSGMYLNKTFSLYLGECEIKSVPFILRTRSSEVEKAARLVGSPRQRAARPRRRPRRQRSAVAWRAPAARCPRQGTISLRGKDQGTRKHKERDVEAAGELVSS